MLRVRLPRDDLVHVYVKTRGTGTWQTDVRKGTPAPESPDGDRFWLFSDLTRTPTVFYIQVTEVSGSGSVPEVLAANPTGSAVIVCDGEELLGAKQNRMLNVTVLVPARGTVRLPVSCVEQGRWSRGSGAFSAASHAAYPELRRRKAERLAAAPLRLGAAQDEVWSAVAEKSIRLGSYSPTGAQAHIFASRGRELADLRGAFALEQGQSGALVALGPDLLCLDYLSRPEAFARLLPEAA